MSRLPNEHPQHAYVKKTVDDISRHLNLLIGELRENDIDPAAVASTLLNVLVNLAGNTFASITNNNPMSFLYIVNCFNHGLSDWVLQHHDDTVEALNDSLAQACKH